SGRDLLHRQLDQRAYCRRGTGFLLCAATGHVGGGAARHGPVLWRARPLGLGGARRLRAARGGAGLAVAAPAAADRKPRRSRNHPDRRPGGVTELARRPKMTTPAAQARGVTPEFRATVYYFIQYMSGAVVTVYGGIWFADQGLSEGEIGILNALPVLIMLLLNVAVGRIADRAADWRSVIVLGGVIGGILPLALFFASGFWGILIVWTLLSLP